MIRCFHVTKRYGAITALRDISLIVPYLRAILELTEIDTTIWQFLVFLADAEQWTY